jgi:hypothetical protein
MGLRLRGKPGYEDIPAWPLNKPSTPGKGTTTSAAPPGKGLRKTQSRNARKRKRAAALKRQSDASLGPRPGSSMDVTRPPPDTSAAVGGGDMSINTSSSEAASSEDELVGEGGGDKENGQQQQQQEEVAMLSLSNKNKRRGFKRDMLKRLADPSRPTRIVFPSDDTGDTTYDFDTVAAAVAAKQGPGHVATTTTAAAPVSVPPSALPSNRLPRNLSITSVDVESPDFVPGQPQPSFVPPRQVTGTRIVNGHIQAPPQPPDVVVEEIVIDGGMNGTAMDTTTDDHDEENWAGWWPELESVKRDWSSLPSIRRDDPIGPNSRVAVQVLEMSLETCEPTISTYMGRPIGPVHAPDAQPEPIRDLIPTGTNQAAPPTEKPWNLQLLLHPSCRPAPLQLSEDEEEGYEEEEDGRKKRNSRWRSFGFDSIVEAAQDRQDPVRGFTWDELQGIKALP